ncbi:uncharacterized protein LOC116177333 [Photinus pyralis]|uniref:uncharacterized protein LOC116160544 n=1 Tax=Photinus pyralis TaxID=7054 RepID=UPI0012675EF0|nr:uncharacterized protein LOC116160544 [Photinus pyralis]XP_031352146.1 uncharacterized protein LOC116177333 [Photinus pyralis]
MSAQIQQESQDSWGSEDDDDAKSSLSVDKLSVNESSKEEQGKETLISAWSLFLDGGIILEVGVTLDEYFFDSIVQISCPPHYEDQYLQFESCEWKEIFNFKTEHLIKHMVQCTPKRRSKHEIFTQSKIIILEAEEEEGVRCIRISESDKSILFSKQAVDMIFNASEVITQKLNVVNHYAMYCLYDDFTRELAKILHTEGVTSEESILSRAKIICQNLKFLTSLCSWKEKYDNLQDFTLLTEIVNIHPRKFINTVVSKISMLK